ncbi:AIDA repeat-containing protein [Escherichia coli]|uniref:AIDA repeat-containing protein n=1 Tax=Escherichia coli TaxID=562 RepID=UPI0012FFBFF0|nr:AIDA repeat-containing protein [Escherichia coli]
MNIGAGLISGSRYDGVNFEISGGSASNVFLENGGQLSVLSRHSAINTTVSSGGKVIVSGTTTSTVIN